MSMASSLPSENGLHNAAGKVAKFVPPTPLVRNETLSRMFGLNIYLKIETVTAIASFKLRGAINCVLTKGQDTKCIVTASTGNHGQGVAYAARVLGKPANIFMPVNPNLEKKRKIENFGAGTTIVGRDYNEAKEAGLVYARENGGLFVDDGDDLACMEGAGTIGVEVGAALDKVDYLVVPMGGGNLISGCGAGIKLRHPDCKVIAIQSSEAPCMHDSFVAKKPVEREVHSLAECLAQRAPADLALQGVLRFVDDSFTVPDADLFSAAKTLMLYAQVLAEPGAAASIACVARNRGSFRDGSTVVLVISGANVDSPTLSRIMDSEPFAASV